jgi:NAD(P)H-hydrate epimerase
LAVDIPSGVNGDTGEGSGDPMKASRTVTMAALKVGLLQGDGRKLAGRVEVAEIGIPVAQPTCALIEDRDVGELLPRRGSSAHKWSSAICVVAGSPGMEGAAALVARGASHAGAGMVRLAVPEAPSVEPAPSSANWPLEAVRVPLEKKRWADEVTPLLKRCRALVIGPGLGRSDRTRREVLRLVEAAEVPVVADADALFALGGPGEIRRLTKGAERAIVLTPHDGEYKTLLGEAPGKDRLTAARRLADKTGAVVLLKGPLTVVASPGDRGDAMPQTLLVSAGSARLATAGTGDVLSGVIGAFLARGLAPGLAAALAAHVHGRAADSGPAEGLVAGDLPDLIAGWLTRETTDG